MVQIRQLTQVHQSATFTDNTTPSLANFETNPTNLETDMNNLRSQVNNLLNAQAGNWYDSPFTGGGGSGGTNDLAITDLNIVPVACFADVLTDVTVTAAQNWEILSVAGSEAPTVVGSTADTTEGAIVASTPTSGVGFDIWEGTERAGSSAIAPNNLLLIRDSTTLQPLQSGGRDIFGLLQVESNFVNGTAFTDVTTGLVKISFVIINGAGDDLIICPSVDIAGFTINYNYPSVIFFKNLDPSCFTGNRRIR